MFNQSNPRTRGVRSARRENHKRVLLIEDEADTRFAMGELLRLWGYDVDEASSGEDGLKAAFATRPTVALVDIGLPDMDGCEVARKLNTWGPVRPTLVAISGKTAHADRRRGFDAGFDVYLTKPLELTLLAEILNSPEP